MKHLFALFEDINCVTFDYCIQESKHFTIFERNNVHMPKGGYRDGSGRKPSGQAKKVLSARVREETYAKLKTAAEMDGRSIGDIIDEMICDNNCSSSEDNELLRKKCSSSAK